MTCPACNDVARVVPGNIVPQNGITPREGALRFPKPLRSVVPADVAAGAIVRIPCDRYGWIELGGIWTNYQVQDAATDSWLDVDAGEMVPAPSSGVLRVRQTGTALGTMRVREYNYESGRDKSRSVVRAIVSSPAGGGGTEDALLNSLARGATTALAAGVQVTPTDSDVFRIRVTADQANANPVFIAETQAKAALLGAAGGGTPIYGAGIMTWYVSNGNLWVAETAGTAVVYPTEDSTA